MKRTLKATTALLASVNLAVPLPALAQAEAQGREALNRAVEACALDATSAECQTATEDAATQGVTDEDIQAGIEAEGSSEAAAPETPEPPAEAGTTTQADTEAGAQAQTSPSADAGADPAGADSSSEAAGGANASAEGMSEAEEATEQSAPEASVQTANPEQGTEADASAQSDELPSEENLSEGLPAETSEAGAETEAGTSGEAEAASEGEATAEAPESDAGNDLPSEDDLREGLSSETSSTDSSAEAEADVEAEADTAGAAETTTETSGESETGADTSETGADGPSEDELRQSLSAESDSTTGAETETEADADSTTGAETETDADATTEADTTDGTSVEEDSTADTSTSADAEVEAEAEGEAGATAQTDAEAEALSGDAPVAAAAAEDAEAVETTSDTVTEETARSSTEDFDSAISRQATEERQSTQASNGNNNDEGGLSNLEKALLVGAGALAVGAILNGNRRVVASSDDRVVVSGRDGGYELIKDDNALLRQPGAQVQTETFNDGSTRTTVTYDDGSSVVTIRDADLRVVRRVRVTPDGERIVLIDDLNENIQPVDRSRLRPAEQQSRTVNLNDQEALRQALSVQRDFDRAYSLSQVRNIAEVRQQVPAVDLSAITFDTGSAAIRPEQADELRELGSYIRETIADNPRAVFLVEGHTDAVGDAAYNLALSDRRAESVALALGEYFNVPTSNLVVQGYGERYLKVNSQDAERANRRATVRNITPLLQVAAAN